MNQAEEGNLNVALLVRDASGVLEAIFERVKGERNVVSGYTGGNIPNPTYEAVCSWKNGTC
ncbi:MAG: peptide-methionine (S)-S-oxide reductase [Desulfosudis oleivorans]|nr:peptide-methionine (S)-S-oxide reductase [Desulfosudis oleivorans]